MTTQTFEIEKIPSSGYILFIDGEQSACPFQPPLVGQTPMGTLSIQRIPCSTICPLAEINRKDIIDVDDKAVTQTWYTTKCGTLTNSCIVTEKQKEQKPPTILKSL